MDELAGTENRIGVARKDYNDAVATFNSQVKKFPGKIVASIFGYDEKEYFKAMQLQMKHRKSILETTENDKKSCPCRGGLCLIFSLLYSHCGVIG